MKRTAFPITIFILAQVAGVAILVLWIVLTASTPSHVMWMVQGILLMATVIIGVTAIFVFWIKMRNLDAERVNFISSVSHELLTPLASLRLYLETLQIRKLDDATRKEFLARMLGDTERLSHSISSILTAARIERRKQLYSFAACNLSALIGEYLDQEAGRFEDAEIIRNLEPDCWAVVDEKSIHSVLANLLDNAVRYSEAPAHIRVSLKRQKKKLRLSVSDRGEGVEESELKRIFKLFYRKSGHPVGTGLGLYIVRRIIRDHRGKVWAERRKSRSGLRIVILLKAEQAG